MAGVVGGENTPDIGKAEKNSPKPCGQFAAEAAGKN